MPNLSTNHELLNVINEDVENVKKEQTYAAQIELTNVPEDSLKQWTNMPPISEELYQELLREFDNDSYYFFN